MNAKGISVADAGGWGPALAEAVRRRSDADALARDGQQLIVISLSTEGDTNGQEKQTAPDIRS